MKKLLIVIAMLVASSAFALRGPSGQAFSVTATPTDYNVMTVSKPSVVYVYCGAGEVVATAVRDSVEVTLAGALSEEIPVPSGVTIPLYGSFDTIRIESRSGGTSTGYVYVYEEK